ncbi:substrate-binding domain-containing protein [Aestuariimicrobium ganziense]|uniref:substrate-binding domain-containing protein n=1 Tax=Aestuariimicrobium ganziense TaxID=2773677 RepID=UPI001942F45E|nr:substrate-binding domain-containing protein [Aestuariimicrobium ganziense]
MVAVSRARVGDDLTAVYAHCDQVGRRFVRAVEQRGLRIGADVSLVVHDDEQADWEPTPLDAGSPPKTWVGRLA